jgi:hypothetical protein
VILLRLLAVVPAVLFWFGTVTADDGPNRTPGSFPAGAEGHLLTALEGQEIQRIPLAYVGAYEDFLGPGYDIHLVRLQGDVAEHVGVAAGMSGSPVYIDGRLIGALAYRFGRFPKDAIAGVTPIEAIRDAARTAVTRVPESDLIRAIDTPISAARLHPALRDWARDQFEAVGMVWTEGLVAGSTDSEVTSELVAGSPIGVSLVRGDWSFAATGTVTSVEDGTVYAFGHPFLGVGAIELPLHSAAVIHTLADASGSTKLARLGREVGALTDDRLAAIVGRLDRRAKMISMVVRIDAAGDVSEHRVEIADAPGLTPLLAGITVANAVVNRMDRELAVTVFAEGAIRLAEKSDLPFELIASGEGPAPLVMVASTVQNAMALLWNNPFEKPRVDSIDVSVTVQPGVRRYLLESLNYDRSAVRPGESLRVQAVLRPLRGEPIRRELELSLPHGISDGTTLRLAVGSQSQIQRALGSPLQRRLRSAGDLSGVIHVMSELKAEHRLMAVLFHDSPAVVRDGVELSRLPSTALHLLSTGARAGAATRSRVSRLSSTQIDLDGPVSGGLTIGVRVGGEGFSPEQSEESP